ncbi:vacuolar ATP synthase subunit S1-domain-containing protein [Mycotypha africana]|uniref:vacuolar ATP synthase subunit S1-domain-containing protein n=1 Tax=Mycotypha africana TaxID=64632 RepID=UPI0023004041|nr:vacuolar ATP synthase subunit S1-domain-containing protein [Mycotypha africana]KAI8991839.1 vacuolar ATP synthase subunit S1-domain-containing protein [Mycotypha africana]
MKLITVASLLSLTSMVAAFESTVPCFMWSRKHYIDNSMKADNHLVISNTDASSTILSSLSPDICSAKLIAIINQPELHFTDFTRSEVSDAFTHMRDRSSQANTQVHFEYITDGVDVYDVAKKIASKCQSSVSILDPSTVSYDDFIEQNEPMVALVPFPAFEDDTGRLRENDALLRKFIDIVEEKVDNDYAFIYTSDSAKSKIANEKRNLQHLHRRAPTPIDNRPIFEKYQLFTPGVFMVLGIVFLFMFIAGTGITWLVGIQTPTRFEAAAAKQKKTN